MKNNSGFTDQYSITLFEIWSLVILIYSFDKYIVYLSFYAWCWNKISDNFWGRWSSMCEGMVGRKTDPGSQKNDKVESRLGWQLCLSHCHYQLTGSVVQLWERSRPLVCSPNVCSSWYWAKLKARVQGSSTWAITAVPELRLESSPSDMRRRHPKKSFMSEPSTCPSSKFSFGDKNCCSSNLELAFWEDLCQRNQQTLPIRGFSRPQS